MQRIIDEFSNLPRWKRYDLRHPERKKERWRQYYQKHKKECTEYNKQWIEKNKERYREYFRQHNKQSHYKLRMEILQFLGGKWCGESDWRCLQVDHVNGGGTKELKELHDNRYRLLKRIKENPENYQLLCANCNWIKRHENREYYKMS